MFLLKTNLHTFVNFKINFEFHDILWSFLDIADQILVQQK